jgi:hypothetical protein
MTIYEEHGFNSRREYLESLAEDFGLAKSEVFAIASSLGKDEDFDGLICALEDRAAELDFN